MDPWACVEGISKHAKSLSVYIYHAYESDFTMSNTCRIYLAAAEDIYELHSRDKFLEVASVEWPLANRRFEENLLLREKLADIDLDSYPQFEGKKLICQVLMAGEGELKRGWCWESIAVEVHK